MAVMRLLVRSCGCWRTRWSVYRRGSKQAAALREVRLKEVCRGVHGYVPIIFVFVVQEVVVAVAVSLWWGRGCWEHCLSR